MTEADIRKYVKTQLGISWVDVEAENKDINELISMALDKLAPYYEGHRFIQATGNIIDLSNHKPLAIEKVYNIKDNQIATLQEYAFGGTGVVLFDKLSPSQSKSDVSSGGWLFVSRILSQSFSNSSNHV